MKHIEELVRVLDESIDVRTRARRRRFYEYAVVSLLTVVVVLAGVQAGAYRTASVVCQEAD